MMKSNYKIPCVRCLLREMNEQTALRQIENYKKSVPKMEQTDPEQYEARLATCKACKWLYQGTCKKCGAYVEARAFRTDTHCPLGETMW